MAEENLDDTGEVLEKTPEELEAERVAAEAEATAETTEEKATRLEKERDDAIAKAEETEKKNKQLFERNKKLQDKANEGGLTPTDVLTLTQAQVHPEDIEEVQGYAKYKGISIKDALADSTLKTIIETRVQERRTAEATQTGTTRRSGGTAPSDEEVLTKAERGEELPATTETMQSIFKGRQARKANLSPKRR